MDFNLSMQLENDFSYNIENLLDGRNHFVFNESNEDFLFFNRYPLAINCVGNSLLVRSSNKNLLFDLKENYRDYPAAWFMEVDNLIGLQKILKRYNTSLKNMGPLMVVARDFKRIESSYKFTRIGEEDLERFAGLSSYALSFENGISDNKIVLACFDNDKLVAIAGAIENSKYLWEVGVEKFDNNHKYRNVAAQLVNNLTYIVRNEYKDISLIYTTQFSHTKSMNVAIRAGFEFALSILVAD